MGFLDRICENGVGSLLPTRDMVVNSGVVVLFPGGSVVWCIALNVG